MESNDQYLARARREAIAKQWELKHAPLADRREARKEFGEAIANDPALVAEHVGWIISNDCDAVMMSGSPKYNY